MKYRVLLLSLLIIGIADSAYTVVVHFSPAALYCPSVNTVVNCAKVLQSQYSSVAGVPLAVLALVWTVVAAVLFLRADRKRMGFAVNVWAIVGIAGVFYSVAAMASLGNICIYCSLLDAIIVLSVLLLYL